MKISCKFCNNVIVCNPKVAAEDFNDEYNQSVENSHANTMGPLTYNPSQDPQGWPKSLLDKYKKNYPGKKDVMPIEDDMGTSTVAIVGNKIMVKCGKCNHVTISGVMDPSANDTYHYNQEINNPDTIFPNGYSNTIHEAVSYTHLTLPTN